MVLRDVLHFYVLVDFHFPFMDFFYQTQIFIHGSVFGIDFFEVDREVVVIEVGVVERS